MSGPATNPVCCHQERAWLLILCAVIGMAGCVTLILDTMIASFFVPTTTASPTRSAIWLQDVGKS